MDYVFDAATTLAVRREATVWSAKSRVIAAACRVVLRAPSPRGRCCGAVIRGWRRGNVSAVWKRKWFTGVPLFW